LPSPFKSAPASGVNGRPEAAVKTADAPELNLPARAAAGYGKPAPSSTSRPA
jgi:hypothetical protein